MEELQPLDNHLEVGKSEFFHNQKIQIQDHGDVALVHTSSTTKEHKKRSPYEEMMTILLRTSECLKSNHTGASWSYLSLYRGSRTMKTSSFQAFHHGFGPHSSLGFPKSYN
jgi:hypothetical protein